MNVTIKGILQKVDDVQQKDTLKYQNVMIYRPVRDSISGELLFEEFFPCALFNESITKCKAKELEGQKVEAGCYLNSQKVEKNGETYHNLRLKINSLKPLSPPQNNP